MKPAAFVSLSLLLAVAASADELVKNAQSELKSAGFYYGQVSGVNSPETVAAVKRYQIRNGLEVTGTLTKETLDALGLGGGGSPAPSEGQAPPLTVPERKALPVEPEPRVGKTSPPPINLRRNPSDQDSDREFLRRSPTRPATPGAPDQPTTALPPTGSGIGAYGHLFAHTPYATAPLEVQQGTVQKAQKFMQNLGLYHEAIDGQPSPATEEAILSYQRFIRLPLTGQLDLETLAAMHLLPGRGGSPMRPAGNLPPDRPVRTLRGVLVR
jgi:peptidoglycan hydrolase-like protein with peptidoglycan-binding domain